MTVEVTVVAMGWGLACVYVFMYVFVRVYVCVLVCVYVCFGILWFFFLM
jgi:hypothetical protein